MFMAKEDPPNPTSASNYKSPDLRCKGSTDEGEWTQRGSQEGEERHQAEQKWLLQEIRGKYTEELYLALQLLKSGSSFSGGFIRSQI